MLTLTANYIASKSLRNLRSFVMDEITKQYTNDAEFDNFQLDYEYVMSIIQYEMFRLSSAKASSPVTTSRDALRIGLN